MRVAIISTYTHPTRIPRKEPSVMQSSVGELIASLCPEDAEIELYNEKETEIPLDRDWDLVFFSYLHAYYEHTKVLSTLLRQRGIKTVAGGRHASRFASDCEKYFDAVVVGEPEPNVPALVDDFKKGQLRKRYEGTGAGIASARSYRRDLLDFSQNLFRLPAVEASRGCPFSCNFCVLTGWEKYSYRPVRDVVNEISTRMQWNKHAFGMYDNVFIFLDNNLGGSPKYLRELCEALIPLKKIWGCAITWNCLEDYELVKLMAKAGCRYVYTGLESLNPEAIASMGKKQNKLHDLRRVIDRSFRAGVLLSFGLLVGSDADTDEYLVRLPDYLADLGTYSITFLGIVCPYPETPFFATVASEGRLLPGTISRDFDGYTLCHRPKLLEPSAAIEHYLRLGREIASLPKLVRNTLHQLRMSSVPQYRSIILAAAPECLSIRAPMSNASRKYIAGRDPIEAWDAQEMLRLGLQPQEIGAISGVRSPRLMRKHPTESWNA